MDEIIVSLFKMSASSSLSRGSARVTALLCSVLICGGDCTGIQVFFYRFEQFRDLSRLFEPGFLFYGRLLRFGTESHCGDGFGPAAAFSVPGPVHQSGCSSQESVCPGSPGLMHRSGNEYLYGSPRQGSHNKGGNVPQECLLGGHVDQVSTEAAVEFDPLSRTAHRRSLSAGVAVPSPGEPDRLSALCNSVCHRKF